MIQRTKQSFLALVAMFIGFSLYAQHPTSTWPYIYDEFTPGSFTSTSGVKNEGQYNVCLGDGSLHFIDGEFVKSFPASGVLFVKIGSDEYINVGGSLLKVLAKSDKSVVVEENTIDYATLNSSGGAYGSTSTTLGTSQLSSIEGIGGSNSNSSLNHIDLKNQKENGESLPLICKRYIVVKGNKVFAAKKDVLSFAADAKDELATFIKNNKIKWKDNSSLLLVGDYLYTTF